MNQARTCVGCRQLESRTNLLRVVRFEGKLQIDVSKKLSGRGSWLHQKLNCLDLAVNRGAFSRAFRSKIDNADLAILKEQAEKMLDK
ncbi:MAG: YlxR family protein [Microbacteriaceae bacterium]|nr:YlxR family protein [Microbacteriaceae bacterium]NBS62583.1 YlxR family protein [Microbacteriaceae bacterium]